MLIGRADLSEVVQQLGDTSAYVVGAGSVPPNPSDLLGSAAMAQPLRDLESRFDLVIIDAPPLLPVTDVAVLSTIAGGTVVVVGAGMVDRDHLAKALQSLEAVQGRLLGLVMNLTPTKGGDAYSCYRAGYAPESPGRRVDRCPCGASATRSRARRSSAPAC